MGWVNGLKQVVILLFIQELLTHIFIGLQP